jgi:hypothetical protein
MEAAAAAGACSRSVHCQSWSGPHLPSPLTALQAQLLLVLLVLLLLVVVVMVPVLLLSSASLRCVASGWQT